MVCFDMLLSSITAQSGQMLTLTERSSSSTKQQQKQNDSAAASTMQVDMYLHNRFQTAIDCFRGAVTRQVASYNLLYYST
jgi:phage gp36-like protein